MFRPLAPSHHRPARRGTSILLIALIMLTLFSAVGTAYVFYAIREAKLAEARKEEQGGFGAPQAVPPDPTTAINAFFGALIYDLGNGNSDLLNGLRGHSIARSMYGYDQSSTALTTPWAGVGVFHEDATAGAYAPYKLPAGSDRAQFINYNLMVMNGSPLLLDPEYTGVRPLNGGAPATFSTSAPGVNYIGKHAGYSYPDLKDFFAGAIDPATGQVLVQSFHRDWLFRDPTRPTTESPLAPTNNNWTNQQGRLLTLRPRPAEHPNFPVVPPNADGTYTGDVQNFPGGGLNALDSNNIVSNTQKNDSLWMDINLNVITLANGQQVKPLVAPLIVPLDGLLNLSAHGNQYGSGNSHFSYAGYGPWEVNLSSVLGSTDASNLIGARNTSYQQRNGATSSAYAPYLNAPPQSTSSAPPYPQVPLPSYAPVAWDNTPIGTPLAYPSKNDMSGLPGFGTAYQNSNAGVSNHPSLFNPTEWPATSTSGMLSRVFPLSDTRRLQRYAFTPNSYKQMQVGGYATNELVGNPAPTAPVTGFYYNTGPSTPANYGYRLDPSHTMRGLFTTRSFDLDRPKLVPCFASGSQLAYDATTNKVGTVAQGPYPSPGSVGSITDFTAANRWSNAMAALGSVNLNRQLADYRSDITKSLAQDTGNATQANIDRQQLARDIFGRLAVATGAALTMNPTAVQVNSTNLYNSASYQYSIPPTVPNTSPQYNALRYLAQLAANIVDYIDNDDISTPFAWNPSSPTEVVYGVEKPRFVINEAYSEITNDPNDMIPPPPVGGVPQPLPGTANAHVRFWLELLNPTATLNPATGPIGDGSVPLSAYKIEIARANRTTGVKNAQTLSTYLTDPANTTGSFDPQLNGPDISYSLSGATVAPNNANYPMPGQAVANGMVLIGALPGTTPNPPEFTPDATKAPWMSATLVGAPNNAPTASPKSNSMAYTIPLPSGNAISTAEFRQHIVLLRRLANPYNSTVNDPSSANFNPSLPANPYVTVDVMDYVPSFDAVTLASGQVNTRVSRPMNGAKNDGTEYDPFNQRFSVGKVQPYAGHSYATVTTGQGMYNTYTFGNANPSQASMVLNQTNSTGATAPMNTFGTHNGANGSQPTGSQASAITTPPPPNGQTFAAPNSLKPANATPVLVNLSTQANNETLMTPFDWYVHMDRPLVNQIELFQVRDTPPHRVTDQFLLGSTNANSASGITYGAGLARWRETNDGLARGLEYLTVKPYTVGVPHGGRVPGRINVNALQDQRVFNALFDPQPGNVFDANGFVNASGSGNGSAWGGWMNTRDMNGVTTRTLPNGTSPQAVAGQPAQTIFDTNLASITSNNTTTNYGRPFLSFGAPAVTPPSTQSATATIAFGAGGVGGGTSNADLTILRADSNPSPYLYTNSNSKAGMTYPSSHPNGPGYMQTEAVRKIMNNTTTVSHTYLVFLTIGYFKLDPNQPQPPAWWPGGLPYPPRLAEEAFLTVPGDMRQKVVAVIDMTNMALDASGSGPATVRPFFTSIESNAYAPATSSTPVPLTVSGFDGTNVYSDGVAVPVNVGDRLVLGYGAEQQKVNVSAVAAPAQPGQPGQITVTGLQFTAWAGTCLSNVIPGYPGPQGSNFSYTGPTALIPYLDRIK